ncbi:MAG: hypothetical protein QMC85_06810 [Methanocellales archaeon]|nr:hypothetical protein [Methanocellales archaeon]
MRKIKTRAMVFMPQKKKIAFGIVLILCLANIAHTIASPEQEFKPAYQKIGVKNE